MNKKNKLGDALAAAAQPVLDIVDGYIGRIWDLGWQLAQGNQRLERTQTKGENKT